MMRAIDIANFFVDLSINSEDNDLTNMKLNKLVYFAQALHLAKYASPLFDEEVQAWKQGPVIPSVYTGFKIYGGGIITKTTNNDYLKEVKSEDIDFLIDIEINYGIFSAGELSRQSQEKGGPWYSVYHEGLRDIVIPKDIMKNAYKNCEFKSFNIDITKIKPVGRRDKDGYLVLPAEMCSPEDDIYDEIYGERV